jgi:hypothetical protein
LGNVRSKKYRRGRSVAVQGVRISYKLQSVNGDFLPRETLSGRGRNNRNRAGPGGEIRTWPQLFKFLRRRRMAAKILLLLSRFRCLIGGGGQAVCQSFCFFWVW